MRVLLVTLNAKYVHTNLALRYIREGIRHDFPDVLLKEFTINEPALQIAGEIFEAKADVIGFSCYIWNMTETMAVIRLLRDVCPDSRIVLGGPEVSYEPFEFMTEHTQVDGIVVGEGEITFLELLRKLDRNEVPHSVDGLVWRENQKIIKNAHRKQIQNLDELPAPYALTEDFTGRLVYVETTRGCPFNCQYCLSSTISGVRFLSPGKFRLMLQSLLDSGAKTIKFVDRTFNVNKDHAFAILDIIREEASARTALKPLRVHCEMAGELLDEDWINYLKDYPPGLLQLEIGVQSTHQPTLEAIFRPQHFHDWKKFVEVIKKDTQIHLHLDLIAGLPKENWQSFRNSFNDVYAVQPDMLQLGFLKVLKGSGLRERSKDFGLIYSPDPPYIILQTNALSHSELLQLRRVEIILDKYYNSDKFKFSLKKVLQLFKTSFDFYHEFAEFWHEQGWFRASWHGKALFEKLWAFIEHLRRDKEDNVKAAEVKGEFWEHMRDALRFDFYLWERPNAEPEFLQFQNQTMKDKSKEIINDPQWKERIPETAEMDHRQWKRNTAAAYFTKDIYSERDGGVWYLFVYIGKVRAYRYEG